MARKNEKIADNFVMFDVTYEDGTRSSRRKINAPGVPREELEAFAMTELMNQDRKIAELGGKDRGKISDIVRSAG
jgi:hypothetical protein